MRLTPPFRESGACALAAARIERLLATHGLTGDPRIPAGLIARVRGGHAPLVQHVLELSELTHLRLYDCLRFFGYDLDDLPLLQAELHRDRTVLLPSTAYDSAKHVTWPAAPDAFAEYADLGRGEFLPELVARFESRSIADIEGPSTGRFLYLRVGRFANALVPTVVPGTIVQIDTTDREPARFMPRSPRHTSRPVYAVAHVRGLTCSYLDWIDDQSIALVSTHGHHPAPIYQLESEAVVLGRVCAELRPLQVIGDRIVSQGHGHCASRVTVPNADSQTFGAFLRASRELLGMTHRDAHAVSVRIAEAYGDPRFTIGVGTLSDWESQRDPPLHIPHLIALAACYSISFFDLLRASRITSAHQDETDRTEPLHTSRDVGIGTLRPALLPAVRIASDLPDLSWDDVFRCGDDGPVFDRVLVGARYVIVNRRNRHVNAKRSAATIDRPLYILSDECGRQICAGCFADADRLYIQPDPHLPLAIRAVPRAQITVRGRVVAALRRR